MNIYAIALGLNTVDVLMVITIACVFRFGRHDGIVAELFKLLGVFFTTFVTLHYYVRLANFFRANFIAKDAVTEIFAFCLLGISIFSAFVVITRGWDMILKIKTFEVVDRWGHAALSLVRGYFICSLIFLGLLVSGNGYFVRQAKTSLSWFAFRMPVVELYRTTHKTLVENIFPGEMINKKVFDLTDETPS